MASHNNPELKPRKNAPNAQPASSSENVTVAGQDLPLRRRQPAPTGQASTQASSVSAAPKKAAIPASKISLGNQASGQESTNVLASRPVLIGASLLVGAVPVLVLGGLAHNLISDRLKDTVITQQQTSAIETSNAFNTLTIDSISTKTRAVSNLGILRNPRVIENTTVEWKTDLFQRFIDQGLSSIETNYFDGTADISSGENWILGQDIDALSDAAAATGLHVETQINEAEPLASTIAASIPIENFETGQASGTLITRILLDDINQEFNSTIDFITDNLEGSEGLLAFAVDSEGRILAGVESEQLGQQVSELFSCTSSFLGQAAIQSEVCRSSSNNQDFLLSYSPLTGQGMASSSGWGVVVAQPEALAFSAQGTLDRTFGFGTFGTAGAIGILGAVLAQILYKQRQAAEEQKQQTETIQTQVLTLLTDIDGASRGDLTVRADVSEGEIGTVADFFNSIVESLRQIVDQVKTAAGEVNTSLSDDEVSVRKLAEDSLRQAEETTRTLVSVEQMSESIQEVSSSARRAAEVTQTVATTAEVGGEVMDRTVQSIVDLRETVAETAKKVKRLGESSQQISKVVSLINEIALQTNLLAINASIEAARAGEEGRGFAVVAEEVGKLAAQSATATKEIETIVQTIQLETGEVVEAMEVGTSQVVEGTQLVEETKRSLQKLFEASGQIDELVQSISTATVSQTQTSQKVSDLMKEIATISEQTSASSRQVSGSLQKTVAIADELQSSVRAFKVDS
ncbi:MAG: methyl-accepting chemotaxis protein [Cyanobacteria bacterium P01_A01_bin.3]